MTATEYHFDPDDSWRYGTPSDVVLWHFFRAMGPGEGLFLVWKLMDAVEPTQEERESNHEPPEWWLGYVNDDVVTGRNYQREEAQRDAERYPERFFPDVRNPPITARTGRTASCHSFPQATANPQSLHYRKFSGKSCEMRLLRRRRSRLRC